jgi:hypothetical protein
MSKETKRCWICKRTEADFHKEGYLQEKDKMDWYPVDGYRDTFYCTICDSVLITTIVREDLISITGDSVDDADISDKLKPIVKEALKEILNEALKDDKDES